MKFERIIDVKDRDRQVRMIEHAGNNRILCLRSIDGRPETFISGGRDDVSWMTMDEVYKLRNHLNDWLTRLERRSNKERRV